MAESRQTLAALTILQPWAWAIIHGGKRIENRTWRTDYRGSLLIHAGKRVLDAAFPWLKSQDLEPPEAGSTDMPLGALVGICHLDKVVPMTDGLKENPWAEGPFCWCLARARPLRVILPFKGQQGLFQVPFGFVREALPERWLEEYGQGR